MFRYKYPTPPKPPKEVIYSEIFANIEYLRSKLNQEFNRTIHNEELVSAIRNEIEYQEKRLLDVLKSPR